MVEETSREGSNRQVPRDLSDLGAAVMQGR